MDLLLIRMTLVASPTLILIQIISISLNRQVLTSATDSDYELPSTFKTKLTFYHQDSSDVDEKLKINEWFNDGILSYKSELDEYYDSKRKLGKLVLRKVDGSVVELYVRPLEGYFVVHKVGESCSMSKYKQEEFHMFDYLNRLLPDKDYLFGPSAIIDKWQKDIAATDQILEDSGDVIDHRLIESRSSMLSYKENVGEQNATVNFLLKRTATPLRRSQGLSHFITRALIREPGKFMQYIEYIAFDKMTDLNDLYKDDPFKLPTGIGCVPDDASKYLKFNSGTRFSGYLISSLDRSKKNFIALDGSSNLLRHDYEQSTNVYDLEKSLAYHMPFDVEPIARELLDNEFVLDSTSEYEMNGECFILSLSSLFKANKRRFSTGLQFLTGSDYMYYMGRSYLRGSLVHVFERIIAPDSELLPFIFHLLPQQQPIDQPVSGSSTLINGDESSNKIYITFYIEAKAGCEYYTLEKTPTSDVASNPRMNNKNNGNDCNKQQPVGVRAVRYNKRTNIYHLIDEISIYDASWLAQKSTENPLTIFDIGKCPLNRIDFSTLVTWSSEKLTLPNDRRILSLAEAVANKVAGYFEAPAISLSDIVQKYQSSNTALITLSLLNSPKCYPSYQFISKDVRSDEIKDTVVRNKKYLTLLECLMIATEYNSVKSLLYAKKKNDEELNECILLSGNNYSQAMSSTDKEEIWSVPNKSRNNKTYYLFFKIRECSPSYSSNAFNSEKLSEENEHNNGVFMKDLQMDDIVLVNNNLPASKLKILSTRIINQQPNTITKILSGYTYDNESDYRIVTTEVDRTVITLTNCMNECENDSRCSSFSFCREDDENFCLISSVKNFTSIDTPQKSPPSSQDRQGNTEKVTRKNDKKSLKMHLVGGHQLKRDSRCEIHVKNYLEYFDPMHSAINVESMNNWKIYDNVEQANICAKNCIINEENPDGDHQNIFSLDLIKNDCLLFLYCKRLHQCLVRLENPIYSEKTGSRQDLIELDEGQSNTLARKYNRFNCIPYKYKNKFLYSLTDQHLKNSSLIATVHKSSLGSCSERCAFELDCVSFDLCNVIIEKINDRGDKDQTTTVRCYLFGNSIYDEVGGWTNYADMKNQGVDSDENMSIQERAISKDCKHYERKQAMNKGKRLSQVELDKLKSTNSMISNGLSILATTFIDFANSANQPERPSLSNKIGPSGSYHMMSEVEIPDLKQRLIIEEWASFKTGQFRLDLITIDERKTYLIYGETGEIFRYQPFSCTTVEGNSDDLGILSEMFKKYNINKNNKQYKDTFIFGIGPLWMLSESCPTKKYLEAKENPTKTRPDLYNYHRFTVSISQDSTDKDDFPFDLNLYFSVDNHANEVPSENIAISQSNQNIGPIEIFEWIDDNKRTFARAKVIYLDMFTNDNLMSSLFDIPVGYGCVRANLDNKWGRSSTFIPTGFASPHQVSIELSVSVPSKEGGPWITHIANVKFIRGALGVKEVKYQIMETQERDDDVDPPAVKRVKKIWEYSSNKRTIVYSIDEETNQCTILKGVKDNAATIEFASTTSAFPSELNLDLDTLKDLFITSDDDYHLIKDTLQSDGRSRIYVHERSIKSFSAGPLTGPASIIRTSVFNYIGVGGETNTSLLSDLDMVPKHQYKSSAIILIYGDERKKLLGKITIRLFDHRSINSVMLHQQLNIRSCILDETKKEYVTIKYPIESPKIANLMSMRTNLIYEQFLLKMLDTMDLQPTNLNQLVINFDSYYMYIRMLLMDLPNRLLIYTEIDGKTLDINYKEQFPELTGGDIKKHLTISADKCAVNCEAYFCKAFSFCGNRKCIVYSRLTPVETDDPISLSKLYKDDKNCRVYIDEDNLVRHDNKPHHVIERMKDIIKNITDDAIEQNDQTNLTIVVGVDDKSDQGSIVNVLVRLVPVAVETDITDIDDYFRDQDHKANEFSLHDGAISTQRWLQDRLVQAEFTLELEGKKFKLPLVDTDNLYYQTNHIAYEDCSLLCQTNNCLSFSYCEADQTCVTSKLHSMAVIESDADEDPHCNVFIRDYLSKFERFPRVKRPFKSKINLKVNSPRECAMNCMETKTMNCLSFEYCPNIDENNMNCYLHSFHGRSLTTNHKSNNDNNPRSIENKEKSLKTICERYSRSYIADFDKFPNRELDNIIVMEPVNFQKLIIDIDAETCAKLCVDNDKCSGFSTCFDASSSIRLSCMIAQVPLKKEYLNKNPTCNTFLLSPKSEFNTRLRHVEPSSTTAEHQEPSETALNQETIVEDDDTFFNNSIKNSSEVDYATSESSDSSWFMKFIILLIGIIIGCAIVHGYKNRSKYLQRIA